MADIPAAPVAPVDISEDPAAPDSAAAITDPLWVAECTADLPWAEVCTITTLWAAECGTGPIAPGAALAACFPSSGPSRRSSGCFRSCSDPKKGCLPRAALRLFMRNFLFGGVPPRAMRHELRRANKILRAPRPVASSRLAYGIRQIVIFRTVSLPPPLGEVAERSEVGEGPLSHAYGVPALPKGEPRSQQAETYRISYAEGGFFVVRAPFPCYNDSIFPSEVPK